MFVSRVMGEMAEAGGKLFKVQASGRMALLSTQS